MTVLYQAIMTHSVVTDILRRKFLFFYKSMPHVSVPIRYDRCFPCQVRNCAWLMKLRTFLRLPALLFCIRQAMPLWFAETIFPSTDSNAGSRAITLSSIRPESLRLGRAARRPSCKQGPLLSCFGSAGNTASSPENARHRNNMPLCPLLLFCKAASSPKLVYGVFEETFLRSIGPVYLWAEKFYTHPAKKADKTKEGAYATAISACQMYVPFRYATGLTIFTDKYIVGLSHEEGIELTFNR